MSGAYYARVPWAAMTKTIIAAIDIALVSTTGQVKVGLEYSMDGSTWTAGNDVIPLIANTSTLGLDVGDNGSTAFGNIARLVMTVSDSSAATPQTMAINGCWASGKPF